MLDAKKFKYEPFLEDSRPVSLQSSGKKLLATDENGNKYVVKHIYMHNAANEYVGCWLAGKLNVPAPKAYLMSIDHRLKSPYGVAIEYFDGLTHFPKDTKPYHKDIAGIFALNDLIFQHDKSQMSCFNNFVACYDFSEAFEVAEWDLTMKIVAKIPSMGSVWIEGKKKNFCEHLSQVQFNSYGDADKYEIERNLYRKMQIETARHALEITDEDIESVVNELALMYDSPIPEYYGFCIEQIREHVRAKFS